jgi:hypothetical protein
MIFGAHQNPTDTVVAFVDVSLDWCKTHRSPDTYEWYRFRLQLFVPHIPADLKTDMPRPFHVREWIDSYGQLSSGSKR